MALAYAADQRDVLPEVQRANAFCCTATRTVVPPTERRAGCGREVAPKEPPTRPAAREVLAIGPRCGIDPTGLGIGSWWAIPARTQIKFAVRCSEMEWGHG